nr:recombinase family protein [uncultured Undibacterium sp.]
MKAIIYTRLSKREAHHQQTGLHTQLQDCEQFCATHGYTVVDRVSEIASGKLGDSVRVVLGDAIKRCRAEDMTLIVSKVDRLSRSSAFTTALLASGFQFKVVQLGINADSFIISIHAAIAQAEREAISSRTKRALVKIKADGKLLGTHAKKIPLEAMKRGQETNRANAAAFKATLSTTINGYVLQGLKHQQIADQLNSIGIKTMLGKSWGRITVLRFLQAV